MKTNLNNININAIGYKLYATDTDKHNIQHKHTQTTQKYNINIKHKHAQ